MLNNEYFYGIEGKTKELMPIFEEYNYFDLIKACFCINICIGNRSALESGLALNQTLLESNFGKKRIIKYDEFTMFFKKVENILQPGMESDYTIEDFGEVKLKVNNRCYSVIIGTGHNHVYACLYLLPYLAGLTNNMQNLDKVMEYHSGIIDFFADINISEMDEEITFKLPSEELFYRTQDFFSDRIKRFDIFTIEGIVGEGDICIEKRHFITKDDSIYPLFNTAILVDVYDIWYKKLEKKLQVQLVEECIRDLLKCYDSLEIKKNNFLFPTTLIQDERPIKKINISFISLCENGTIIAINEDLYEKDEVIELINDIEQKHKIEQLQFVEKRSRNNDKQCLAVSIASKEKIEFIVYNSFSNIEDTYVQMGKENKNKFKCTALDLIEYLLFMDNMSELYEYIEYDFSTDYNQLFLFGGDSGRFFSWKDQNHMIAKGAIKFDLLNLGHNTENEFIYRYFKDKLCDYPWDSDSYIFANPFTWKVNQIDNGFWDYISKYARGFGGVLRHLSNECVLFFANNIDYYKDIENPELYIGAIPFLNDLNITLVSSCKKIFEGIDSFAGKLIVLIFIPGDYIDKSFQNNFVKDPPQYVFSELLIGDRILTIRYTININSLYKDISKVNCRKVEVEYFKELFSGLKIKMPNEYELVCSYLESISNDKKMVDVDMLELNYLWNENNARYYIKDQMYLQAKKNIANVCCTHKIKPGKYYGDDANKVIRKMQRSLINNYESYICKFDCFNVHTVLLELYAEKTHNVNLHLKKYNSFKNLNEKVREEVRSRIIKEREEYKHQLKVLNYAIETNLFVQTDNKKMITDDEIEYLLAFSNWLVVLSDNADIFHFTDEEAYIEISSEYVVDICEIDNRNKSFGNIAQRVYGDDGYKIAGDECDSLFYEKFKRAFKKDVGFEWSNFIDVMNYLQCFTKDDDIFEIRPNVYVGIFENIVNKIAQEMKNKEENEHIRKILNYLTINTSEIKSCNGTTDFYLPIGQRKYRHNRFEVKCVWRKNDKIIFSPPVVNYVQQRWIAGSLEFYLPYEIGLPCTKKIITEWKAIYEKRIVYDIASMFNSIGLNFVKTNLELCKIDKNNKHPQNLGDYDVFVIDSNNKKIWMIECKVIEKVGSFYEMYRQQNRFFYEHKEDEMFQRRIDYMNEHYHQVLGFYGYDSQEEYTIWPYMVMNKVLVSRYKKIQFPIISYSELRNIIES